MKPQSFARHLEGFFREHLVAQHNVSPHTIASYRDAWRLYLRTLSTRTGRSVDKLQLEDVTEEAVLAFLHEVEHVRGDTIGTRNCRLAAIRSFCRYAMARDPSFIAQLGRVVAIPVKRYAKPAMCYLEVEEIDAILRQPDLRSKEGQRDHALMALLFNTGARIQEALNLNVRDLRLTPPLQIRLMGKGRKERICALWEQTAQILVAYFKRSDAQPEDPAFRNRQGERLSAAGFRFRLSAYTAAAIQEMPTLKEKSVTPHTFRHSLGVALVSENVEITLIQSIFGHSQLETTNHYARANEASKRKALERIAPADRPRPLRRWRDDPDLMKFLDSL